MKIKGRIVEIGRNENRQEGESTKIYASARVVFEQSELKCNSGNFMLYGYEPEVKFEIGQKVTIELEEVGA